MVFFYSFNHLENESRTNIPKSTVEFGHDQVPRLETNASGNEHIHLRVCMWVYRSTCVHVCMYVCM